MKIIAVETSLTRIPFDMGAKPVSFGGVGWQALNTLWVRIVTDQGLEGWGEGFGHACVAATKTVCDTQLAPAILGQDARDIAGLRARLSKTFHLFGRNGPHLYALSALDIALWDIAGKAAGLPLWQLWGGAPRTHLTAYASLLRYGAPDLVGAACERAVARGNRDIKLHEIEVPMIRAAREAIGPEALLMMDRGQSLAWDVATAISRTQAFSEHGLTWMEEPLEPTDVEGFRRLRQQVTCLVGTGEREFTMRGYRRVVESGISDVVGFDPGRAGGITGGLQVIELVEAADIWFNAHTWSSAVSTAASLALSASTRRCLTFELKPLANPMQHELVPEPFAQQNGWISVGTKPGLGIEVIEPVLEKYRLE